MAQGRAKLPLEIRRKVQAFVRNFVFIAIAWLVAYNWYTLVLEYQKTGDVMKNFGFNAGTSQISPWAIISPFPL